MMQQSRVPDDPFESYYAIPGRQLVLSPNRMVHDFTITTDGYILLCTQLYEVLCAENSSFADKVSESAFQYYAIMLLWQRLRQFLPLNSMLSPFLDTLLQIEKYLTNIPTPLEIYLKGIGNYEHPTMGEMRFRLPKLVICEKFDLTTGAFGKVSADTHFLYEAFPAPGIAALRILADIKMNTSSGVRIWDLPEHLRPDVNDNSPTDSQAKSELPKPMPTKNLLGWSPAKRLTKNQLEFLRDSGIDNELSQKDLSTFFLKSGILLAAISRYFVVIQTPPVSHTSIENGTQVNTTGVGISHNGLGSTTNIPTSIFGSTTTSNTFGNSPIFAGKISTSQKCSPTSFGTAQPSSQTKPTGFVFHTPTLPEEITVKEKSQGSVSSISGSFGYPNGFTKVKRLPLNGSSIQGLSVEKVSETFEFNRFRMYCDGIVSVFSSSNINDKLATGAVVAGYRMPKEAERCHRHAWSCYDFNEYESVPQTWVSTRNSIYEFGSVQGINQPMWGTGFTERRLLQNLFLKKHVMPSEDNWNVYM